MIEQEARDRVDCPVCAGQGTRIQRFIRRNIAGIVSDSRLVKHACTACHGHGFVSAPAIDRMGYSRLDIAPGEVFIIQRWQILMMLREEWGL